MSGHWNSRPGDRHAVHHYTSCRSIAFALEGSLPFKKVAARRTKEHARARSSRETEERLHPNTHLPNFPSPRDTRGEYAQDPPRAEGISCPALPGAPPRSG